MSLADFPALNASLNFLSAVFLTLGLICIRQEKQVAHRNCMLTAFGTSTLFLLGYVTYHISKHYLTGSGVTRFAAQGWIRPVYFAILLTHTLLAAVIMPLILITLARALTRRFELHRKIARWTWPLWMYVSVTGVVIYWMLYHL